MYLNILKKFKLRELKKDQAEIIENTLQHKNQLVVAGTGYGKSMLNQFPAAIFVDKLVVVISPLLALIDDQVSYLK